MTDAEIAAALAVCEAAAAPPWIAQDGYILIADGNRVAAHVYRDDAAFIALARSLVPELIAEVQRLHQEIAREVIKGDDIQAEADRLAADLSATRTESNTWRIWYEIVRADNSSLTAELATIRETWPRTIESFRGDVAHAEAERDAAVATIAKLEASWDRVGQVLADEGCSCEDDPEERCLGNRVESAWRSKP